MGPIFYYAGRPFLADRLKNDFKFNFKDKVIRDNNDSLCKFDFRSLWNKSMESRDDRSM